MVAVLALVGGACGGDDDGGATDDASTSDADNGDDESASGSDSEWCNLIENAETPEALDNLDIDDPDSVEDAFQSVVELFDDAADAAPDEIEEDVQVLADQFREFFDELEDADFNPAAIDPSVLDNPEADAASERIDDFCGLDPDAGELDDTEDLGDVGGTGQIGGDTAREQMVSVFELMGMNEEQANCVVDNIDLEELEDASNVDPTQYFELFADCGFDITNPDG